MVEFIAKMVLFILDKLILWALTCGFLFLICLCFSIEFDILKATGIFLIVMYFAFLIEAYR